MANVMKLFLCFTYFMAFLIFGDTFSVSVEKLSTLYLPYQYSPTIYGIDEHASEAVAYDAEKRILYSVGANNIQVINMSDVTNMVVIYHTSVQEVEMTDVELCGDHIFVAMEDLDDPEQGFVHVYKRYDEINENLELVANITVGPMPDMILPTSNCTKLVVAIEAEPYRVGVTTDPLGAVTIIKFQDLAAGVYTMNVLNFSHFDDNITDLEQEGVRFVYQDLFGNTFANDAEPEYIAFNHNETLAYICLQENNAIAVVDLASEEIIRIHGLGFKDWSQSEMDASDEDGGINMKPWPVYGMYQPDAIKFITIRDIDYIVTANEGYYKYDESKRMKYVSLSGTFESDPAKLADLRKVENLGNLLVSKVTGHNVTEESHDALYSFGGRSFSIWRADDMSLIYDSGSSLSNHTAMLNPNLFNMDVDVGDVALDEIDTRSDNNGPEPESLAIAKFGNYTLIIVGNEQPGTLLLYSIDERNPTIEPKFEAMFHDIQRIDAEWSYLVGGHHISMLDPEDMRYIPAADSPNGRPLLAVSAGVSGTVTLLQLNVEFDGSPTTSTGTSSHVGQTSQPIATTSPSRVQNQTGEFDFMDETAYLASVSTLAGVVGVGTTAVVAYALTSQNCRKRLCIGGVVPVTKTNDDAENN